MILKIIIKIYLNNHPPLNDEKRTERLDGKGEL